MIARRFSLFSFSVCCLLLLASVALAGESGVRWVETASWNGTGTVSTEPFAVFGGRWRVKFYPETEGEEGTFDIQVLTTEGEELARAAVSKKPVPGWRTFKDKSGFRVLRIVAAGMSWRVAVEQRLDVEEQWRLKRIQDRTAPTLRQVGVWASDDEAETHRFTVPIRAEAWRISLHTEGEGTIEVALRGPDGRDAMHAVVEQSGEVVGWGYGGGEYTLVVGARNASWRAVLHAAELP